MSEQLVGHALVRVDEAVQAVSSLEAKARGEPARFCRRLPARAGRDARRAARAQAQGGAGGGRRPRGDGAAAHRQEPVQEAAKGAQAEHNEAAARWGRLARAGYGEEEEADRGEALTLRMWVRPYPLRCGWPLM